MNEDDGAIGFKQMGLDERLLKAITQLKWTSPTDVQQKSIPLVLDGKDILLKARTGSGKTAAYIIPIIQWLLNVKKEKRNNKDFAEKVSAVVLVPSRDLSQQAFCMIQQLSAYCGEDVSSLDVSLEELNILKPNLAMCPDIVVGTPSRVLACIKASLLDLSTSLQWLVLDEADLLHTFGYERDIKSLMGHINNTYQSLLLSATLTEDVETLQRLVLHNPVMLNLTEEESPVSEGLTQYYIRCDAELDKFVFIYALLKLKLLPNSCLIFVNSVQQSYRLKLYLEQFSIRCCVLNSELPANSRHHVMQQFNKGTYKYVIATDESSVMLSDTPTDGQERKDIKRSSHTKRQLQQVNAYSTSRGLDFKSLVNVINFDFPSSIESYVHRVGRTARADQTGTAMSLVRDQEFEMFINVQQRLSRGTDAAPIKTFAVDMNEVSGLRYRCQSVLASITSSIVKRARLQELRSEILVSTKLKDYFEENPRDFSLLRHDNKLNPDLASRRLKKIPEYLFTESLKGASHITDWKGKAPLWKRKKMGGKSKKKIQHRNKKSKGDNPLRSFKYSKKK